MARDYEKKFHIVYMVNGIGATLGEAAVPQSGKKSERFGRQFYKTLIIRKVFEKTLPPPNIIHPLLIMVNRRR